MSGSRPFTRQLGSQSGVQLNPLQDQTDGVALTNADQIFAMVARLTRGRIDRPIRVNRSNLFRRTGPAASIRANLLNEAKVQAYEALSAGAYEGVLQRLSADDAVKSYGVVNWGAGAVFTPVVASGEEATGVITQVHVGFFDPDIIPYGGYVPEGGSGYTDGDELVFVDEAGSGAAGTITVIDGVITAVTLTSGGSGYVNPTVTVNVHPTFEVSPTIPADDTFKFYFMHHDCHNDGIKVAFHADTTPVVGTATATQDIKIQFLDSTGIVLDQFEGSLNPEALDDFNQTKYLPDVIAARSDSYDLVVAPNVEIEPSHAAYGRGSSGDKYVTSDVLYLFDEGTLTYTNTDYDRCISALRQTTHPFGYLITGGTQSVALLSKLAAFAVEINTCIGLDIDGRLGHAAAMTFFASLNIDTHYVHPYWAPLECDDPLNGGKAVWGTAGYNIGLRCGRNARTNDKGFAPKNYPVAGKEWPLVRTGIRQLVTPEEQDLSDLAKTKINPVLFRTFSDGGRYVYVDSLTSAKTETSYKKLISVAEMSSTLDLWITLAGNDWLQLPMSEYIKRMNAFLDKLFPDAVASKWLVPSVNLPNGVPFQFLVSRDQVRPADRAHIEYWASYDGVARQAFVQQNLVK